MGKAAKDIQAIWKKTREAALTATLNASDDIQSTGRDTVREWRNKVDFSENVYNGLDRIEVLIKPKGKKKAVKIFQYVDLGTKPHIIMPKIPGTYLKFRTNYSARTAPINKYNQGSGMSFGQWATKAMVYHPGNDARKFLETDLNELVPSFQQRVQQAITKAVT